MVDLTSYSLFTRIEAIEKETGKAGRAEKKGEKKRKGRQMNVERGETGACSPPPFLPRFTRTAKAKQLNKDF